MFTSVSRASSTRSRAGWSSAPPRRACRVAGWIWAGKYSDCLQPPLRHHAPQLGFQRRQIELGARRQFDGDQNRDRQRLVDPGLAPSAKKKKWERLWKTSKGKDGTLMDYALCVQNSPGGVAGGGGGSGGGAQSDALVSFNGVAVGRNGVVYVSDFGAGDLYRIRRDRDN